MGNWKHLLPVLLFLGGWGFTPAYAQPQKAPQPQPVVVVRFPSYEGLLDDIDYLGRLAGNPEASQQVEAMLALFTGGKGLQGLDQKRPCGAAMWFQGGEAVMVAFVPCTDSEKLLALLEQFADEVRPLGKEQLPGPRFFRCRVDQQRFYLRADPKWLWLARSKELLEQVPPSPQPWLKRLQEFDLAAELRYQRLPAVMRLVMKMGMLSQAFEQSADEEGKLSQEKLDEARKEVEFFFKVIDSLDRITLGALVDGQKRLLRLDLTVDLLPESYWSKWAGALRKGTTLHRGFLSSQAAMSFHFNTRLDAQARQFLVKEILEVDTPEQIKREARKQVEVDEDSPEYEQELQWNEALLQLLRLMALGDSLDVCGALESDGRRNWFLLAISVVQNEKELQQVFQRLLGPMVQFRMVTIGSQQWKLASFPVEDADLKELLGGGTQGTVALGNRTAYLVFGPEAEKRLRQRLASPLLGKPAPPEHVLQIRLNPAQLIRLAHQLEPDEETEELVKQLPKDAFPVLSIYGDYTPQREHYRAELNEAALQLLIELFRWGFNQALEEELAPEF